MILYLDKISVLLKDMKPEFNINSLLLKINPDMIILDTLHATKGAGTITGRGSLPRKSNYSKRTGLYIDFENINIKSKLDYIRNVESVFSGNLIVKENYPFRVQ